MLDHFIATASHQRTEWELAGYWFFGEDRFVSLEEAEQNFDEQEKMSLLKPLYMVDDSRALVGLVAV